MMLISSLKGYSAWLKAAEVGGVMVLTTREGSTVTQSALRRNATRMGIQVATKRVYVVVADDKKPRAIAALLVEITSKE